MAVFGIAMVLGALVAYAIRGNDDDDVDRRLDVVLEQGDVGGDRWSVHGRRDEQGELCVEIRSRDETVTGACGFAPQEATFEDRTVVFGLAPEAAARAEVALDNGLRLSITTDSHDDFPTRYYVALVDGDVDLAEPDAVFLDGSDNRIEP